MSWFDDFIEGGEDTMFTGAMFAVMTALADRAELQHTGYDLWPELRVAHPLSEARWVFMGQGLSPQGLTGTGLDRLTLWRRYGPVTFVSIQGNVGWLITLYPDDEVPHRISTDPTEKRYGWLGNTEMLKIALDAETFDRTQGQKHPCKAVFDFNLRHRYVANPDQEGMF